jgi:hypothetical protein
MEEESGARRTVDATRDPLALLNLYLMAGIARTPRPRLARKRMGEVRMDCKPRANNRLFRGEIGVSQRSG